MSPREIEGALVAELRKLPVGEQGKTAALRAAIGCTGADLQRVIDKLRMQGKLIWGRLELAGSMRLDPEQDQPLDGAQDMDSAEAPGDGAPPESSGDEPEAGGAAHILPAAAQADGGAQVTAQCPPAPAAEASPPVPPPPTPVDVPDQPTGEQLHAEILAWLERTRTPKLRLLDAIGGTSRLIEIRKAQRPRPATVERIRKLLADHPNGLPAKPSAPPGGTAPKDAAERGATRRAKSLILADAPPANATLEDQVRHEAEMIGARRRLAGSTSHAAQELATTTAPRTVAEQIQSEVAAEPVDLMRAINRRHPQLWRRVLALGRARGDAMPSAALYDALEEGLDRLERQGARG